MESVERYILKFICKYSEQVFFKRVNKESLRTPCPNKFVSISKVDSLYNNNNNNNIIVYDKI